MIIASEIPDQLLYAVILLIATSAIAFGAWIVKMLMEVAGTLRETSVTLSSVNERIDNVEHRVGTLEQILGTATGRLLGDALMSHKPQEEHIPYPRANRKAE